MTDLCPILFLPALHRTAVNNSSFSFNLVFSGAQHGSSFGFVQVCDGSGSLVVKLAEELVMDMVNSELTA